MWMTSTDDRGYVKYWQANLNNVHTFQAHNDPVRSSRWDKIISTAVLLLILVISNSCNIDDKINYCNFVKITRYAINYYFGAVSKYTRQFLWVKFDIAVIYFNNLSACCISLMLVQ